MEDAKTSVKRQFDDDDGDLKDIDAELGSEEDDDVPDETMSIAQPSDTWLVKLPKSLMEKWAKVDRAGVPLASMRVMDQQIEGKYVINLSLPDNPEYDVAGESTSYTLSIPHNPINQFAFTDAAKRMPDGQPNHKKARTTSLTGRIAHQGALIPVFDDTYRKKIKSRRLEKETPKRTTVLIENKTGKGGLQAGGLAFVENENALQAGRANFKMLASGAGKPSVGFALSEQKKAGQSTSTGKKGLDKAYRFSKEEVLDALFNLFKEQQYWSMKDLRKRTQQPEQYLKGILREIAVSPKAGPNAHMWHLKAHFASTVGGASGGGVKSEGGAVKAEGVGEEEEEEDDDMEEVGGDDDDDDDEGEDEFEEIN